MTKRVYAEMVATEIAEVRRLEDTHDPWVVLRRAGQSYEMSCRSRYYSRFVGLTATYPDADVDMLLHEARRVFHVRLVVLRADVARAREIQTLNRMAAL